MAYLECPCCGDAGAESADGLFFEGHQPILCGCNVSVMIDDAGPDAPEVYLAVNEDGVCPPNALCRKEA